jgi:hypothetical protein
MMIVYLFVIKRVTRSSNEAITSSACRSRNQPVHNDKQGIVFFLFLFVLANGNSVDPITSTIGIHISHLLVFHHGPNIGYQDTSTRGTIVVPFLHKPGLDALRMKDVMARLCSARPGDNVMDLKGFQTYDTDVFLVLVRRRKRIGLLGTCSILTGDNTSKSHMTIGAILGNHSLDIYRNKGKRRIPKASSEHKHNFLLSKTNHYSTFFAPWYANSRRQVVFDVLGEIVVLSNCGGRVREVLVLVDVLPQALDCGCNNKKIQ